MAKIIAVVNQKGGVGKTTTCVSLTAALTEKGKKVLLCDFDPQANSTSGMGVDKTVSAGVYDVLINGTDVEKAIVSTKWGDVLPSSKSLAGAGIEMIALEDREQLTISGVEEVESFDENSIILSTALGGLEVQGEGLHIEKLSLDGGDLKVEGTISALIYDENRGRSRGGFLSRLLGG